MKRTHGLFLVTTLMFVMACGESPKKQQEDLSSEIGREKNNTSGEININLKQEGDYTRLYALDDGCKLTDEEIATLYGISPGKIKETYNQENSNGGTYCSFQLNLNNGITSTFGITSFKMDRDNVIAQTNTWKTGSYEQQFLKLSDSGDHYIWKHPNQGWYMLQNPNYANGIKVNYRNMLKLDQAQSEYLEMKGLQAVEYLIEKYKD